MTNQQSPFYQSIAFMRMIRYVQKHPNRCRLKEEKDKLSITIQSVPGVDDANAVLREILAYPEQ